MGERVFVTSQQWGSVIGVVTKLLYADQLYLVIQSEETGTLQGVPATACAHMPEDISLSHNRVNGMDERDDES